MIKAITLSLILVGCSGSVASQPPAHELPTPPSAVVEDCSAGCGMVRLDQANTDVSYLVAADTTLKFDLSKSLCVRLTTPADSASELHAADSGYTLTGCQVFVSSPYSSYEIVAGPPGVPSWVRAETGCNLSCNQVNP